MLTTRFRTLSWFISTPFHAKRTLWLGAICLSGTIYVADSPGMSSLPACMPTEDVPPALWAHLSHSIRYVAYSTKLIALSDDILNWPQSRALCLQLPRLRLQVFAKRKFRTGVDILTRLGDRLAGRTSGHFLEFNSLLDESRRNLRILQLVSYLKNVVDSEGLQPVYPRLYSGFNASSVGIV
jgi:hypothetical protein